MCEPYAAVAETDGAISLSLLPRGTANFCTAAARAMALRRLAAARARRNGAVVPDPKSIPKRTAGVQRCPDHVPNERRSTRKSLGQLATHCCFITDKGMRSSVTRTTSTAKLATRVSTV